MSASEAPGQGAPAGALGQEAGAGAGGHNARPGHGVTTGSAATTGAQAAPPALCVSIHDVAPPTWDDCQRLHDAVRAVADIPLTWLVVPCYHGARSRAPAFEAGLDARLDAGHELALHGYTHRDDVAPAPWLSLQHWMRRVYTRGEGEFAALDEAQARARIALGQAWFAARGWPLHGFVAPAWLLGSGAWRALGQVDGPGAGVGTGSGMQSAACTNAGAHASARADGGSRPAASGAIGPAAASFDARAVASGSVQAGSHAGMHAGTAAGSPANVDHGAHAGTEATSRDNTGEEASADVNAVAKADANADARANATATASADAMANTGAAPGVAAPDFLYTTTLTHFYWLRHGGALWAPSLVYTARNQLGRLVSPRLLDLVQPWQRQAPLVRLSLHPSDARHPALLRHMQHTLARLLAQRQAMTKVAFALAYQRGPQNPPPYQRPGP